MDESVDGSGWLVFAGIMVLIAGTLSCIWGIAAIDGSTFFVEDTKFIDEDLNTMGWVVLGIGALQLIAALSIWTGVEFGRWIGVIGASLGALGALLSIPGFQLWSVCVFSLNVLVVYGLTAYGGRQARAHMTGPAAGARVCRELSQRGADQGAGQHVGGVMHAGVDARLGDGRGEGVQRYAGRRQDAADAGREREGGGGMPGRKRARARHPHVARKRYDGGGCDVDAQGGRIL